MMLNQFRTEPSAFGFQMERASWGCGQARGGGAQREKSTLKHYILEPLDLRNVYHGNSSLTRVYFQKQDQDSCFAHARNSKINVVNVVDSATNTTNDP
jgi:hypothetical protein